MQGTVSATTACLNTACLNQCGFQAPITGEEACDCPGTGTGDSTSTGTVTQPPCTGGVGMAGSACVNDYGCQSCNCDQGTCY